MSQDGPGHMQLLFQVSDPLLCCRCGITHAVRRRLVFIWKFFPTVSVNNAPCCVGSLCLKTAIIPLSLIVMRPSSVVIMSHTCYVCKCSPPTVSMNNAPCCRASVTQTLHKGGKPRWWCFLESWGSYSVSGVFSVQ